MFRFRSLFIKAVLSAAYVATTACSSESGMPAEPTPTPTPAKTVASVEITGAPLIVAVGINAPLTATARAADGSVVTGKTATWQSSAVDKATVSPTGVVTGVAEGSLTITATIDGKSATADVTVRPAGVAAVTTDSSAITLALDEVRTLVAVARDAQNNVLPNRVVTWVSNKPDIVSVDPATGKITAKDGGSAIVTATIEGRSVNINVTVNIPVATVEIVSALDTLEAYDVIEMHAVLKDAQGRVLTGRTVVWSSSNASVATINNANATLTGVDRGTVTVTATSEGKSATATRVVVIRYRYISAGTMHACDLASGGIAWCWGLNGAEGRIGSPQVGDNVYSSTPVQVPGGLRFTQLATFGRTTCAIALNADAYCWGNNGWGVLGSGSNAAMSTVPVKVAGGHKFVKISAGSDHACGIDNAGKAWCWGNNDWRQQGAGTSAASNVPVAVLSTASFVDISAGTAFTCALAVGGAAYCWGANNTGQVGDGLPLTNANVFQALPQPIAGGLAFVRIAVGSTNACALTGNGAMYCWGNNNGKFGNGGTTSTSTPVTAAGGLVFNNLSVGFGHTCGVLSSLEVRCWGSNGYGQLGNGVGNGSLVPVRAGGTLLAAETSAAGIGTGSAGHTCAISHDRLTTLCWGRNDVGQLGNGTTAASGAFNPTATIVVGQKPL